jgi:hypothetical protein
VRPPSDSIALSRTCAASSALTSRLTSMARRARPAGRDSPNAVSTARTSSRNMRQASKGLSSTPRASACSHHAQAAIAPVSTAASTPTQAAPRHQASAPSTNTRAAFAAGASALGAMRRPMNDR